VILIDERPGRAAARTLGLRTAGNLGELLHAKLAGWLPMLRPEMMRLRLEARFIDSEIDSFILSKAGE
jgi:predicted nucleic acid-binding protein